MKIYVKPGVMLTVTAPTGGVTSGDLVRVGDIIGVAATTESAGDEVEVQTQGVFDLAKEAGLAVAEGDALYFDEANSVLTTFGGGQCVGVAEDAALAAATTVRVKLTGSPSQQTVGVARGVFDATGGVTTASSPISIGPVIPDNARVIRSYREVITTFTSATDAATIGLGVPTDDVSGILAPIAISDVSNPHDAGVHDNIQDGAAANFGEKLTDGRQMQVELAVEDLTAGKMIVWAEYVVSE